MVLTLKKIKGLEGERGGRCRWLVGASRPLVNEHNSSPASPLRKSHIFGTFKFKNIFEIPKVGGEVARKA
jgi:hypothetical protein